MPKLMSTTSDLTQATDALACYLQVHDDATPAPVIATELEHSSTHLSYRLPQGTIELLNIAIYLSNDASKVAIDAARQAAIKSALIWQKRSLQANTAADNERDTLCHYVLVLNIISTDRSISQRLTPMRHSFGARYFMEELLLDITETSDVLAVLSRQDWQAALAIIKTPSDLWRFLSFYNTQLKRAFTSGVPSFNSEQELLQQFLASTMLFTQAIAVDNALIKYAMQDKPNAALITMSLAQKNNSVTAKMYQQHMQQAAIIWSQMITQMIELALEKMVDINTTLTTDNSITQWQQQLLDESLFSRHELTRTIYKHPKQSSAMLEQGYVVHQHSYESLGRHYVLIFYGKGKSATQSKISIQPNLALIAQDVATRLPLLELHHVVVFGIEFVEDDDDTFIDIDLWIQPVQAMTPKERQLTKKLQRLTQREGPQKNQAINDSSAIQSNNYSTKLPSLNLNLTVKPHKKS